MTSLALLTPLTAVLLGLGAYLVITSIGRGTLAALVGIIFGLIFIVSGVAAGVGMISKARSST